NEDVLDNLAHRMEEAATALEYERAARFRDQIALIRRIQGEQVVAAGGATDADAIAVHTDGRQYCVSLLVIRAGRVLGSRNQVPRAVPDTPVEEVLGAFLVQHYFQQPPPEEILLGHRLPEPEA